MDIVTKIDNAILEPVAAVLGVLSVLLFLWGVFQLIYKADDPDARDVGRRHVMYGVLGVFIIVAVHPIVSYLSEIFNGKGR